MTAPCRVGGMVVTLACIAVAVGCARRQPVPSTVPPRVQQATPEALHPLRQSRIITLDNGVSARDEPPAPFQPGGIVAGSDGSLLIFDNRGGSIDRFSPEGKRTQTISAVKPDREGDRSWSQSLAETADGTLLLADTEEGLVRRFARSGEPLTAVKVAQRAQWSYPSMGLAPDPAGGFYLADQRSDEGFSVDPIVRRFTLSGRLLREHPLDRGDRDRFAGYVGALAVDPEGTLWVWLQGMPSDMSTNWCRRFRFTPDGPSHVEEVETSWEWGDIVAAVFGGDGERYELWFHTPVGGDTTLAKFDRAGSFLWALNWPGVEGTGLALGREGHVFVVFRQFAFFAPICIEVDANGNEIRSLDRAGKGSHDLRSVPCPGPPAPLPSDR